MMANPAAVAIQPGRNVCQKAVASGYLRDRVQEARSEHPVGVVGSPRRPCPEIPLGRNVVVRVDAYSQEHAQCSTLPGNQAVLWAPAVFTGGQMVPYVLALAMQSNSLCGVVGFCEVLGFGHQ